MADRNSFNARVENTRRKAEARRKTTMDDVDPTARNALEWIADVVTGFLTFGWLWTVQGLAFAVLAALAFLRFLDFDVDVVLAGAFVLFLVVAGAYHFWNNG